jgi:hypothetical protein
MRPVPSSRTNVKPLEKLPTYTTCPDRLTRSPTQSESIAPMYPSKVLVSGRSVGTGLHVATAALGVGLTDVVGCGTVGWSFSSLSCDGSEQPTTEDKAQTMNSDFRFRTRDLLIIASCHWETGEFMFVYDNAAKVVCARVWDGVSALIKAERSCLRMQHQGAEDCLAAAVRRGDPLQAHR